MALVKKFEITTAYNDIYDITESVKETVKESGVVGIRTISPDLRIVTVLLPLETSIPTAFITIDVVL